MVLLSGVRTKCNGTMTKENLRASCILFAPPRNWPVASLSVGLLVSESTKILSDAAPEIPLGKGGFRRC